MGIIVLVFLAITWGFLSYRRMKHDLDIYNYDTMVGVENFRRNMTKLNSPLFTSKSVWRKEDE